MKHLLFLLLSGFIFSSPAFSQKSKPNIGGKWYGYAIQDTGELCTTCNFELEFIQKRSIYGQSRTWQQDTSDIQIALNAYFDKEDTLHVIEDEGWVLKRQILVKNRNWQPCVKRLYLKYSLIGTTEFLLGRGTGEALDWLNQRTQNECIPALMVFSRNKNDLDTYLNLHRDSLMRVVRGQPENGPMPDLTADFLNTAIKKITEIEVEHPQIQVQIRDYLREDNDTVSVYLNRKLLASKKRISKKALIIPLTVRPGVSNELLIYADNLGQVAPNTSEMYVVDGKKSYRIMIESDKQKTAAVYLRYTPKPKSP